MTSTPDFARLDAIDKKLEQNDEDIRQIADDFPHSEPASRSRRLVVDESFTAIQTERKEAVAGLKLLQPKWEAGLSALEAERASLRKEREEVQAEKESLKKEQDELQEQKSKYQQKSLDLNTSIKKREDVVAKHEQTLRKAYGETAKAYGEVAKAMKKPFDQPMIQSSQRSPANVISADKLEQLVHTVSELKQQLLHNNDTLEDKITTAVNNVIRRSVDHAPRIDPPVSSFSIHDNQSPSALPSRPHKRPAEAERTEQNSLKRRTPSRHGERAQSRRHSETTGLGLSPATTHDALTRQSITPQFSSATMGTSRPLPTGVGANTETQEDTRSLADSQPSQSTKLPKSPHQLRSSAKVSQGPARVQATAASNVHANTTASPAKDRLLPGTQAPQGECKPIWQQIQLKGQWTDDNCRQLLDYLEESSLKTDERYRPVSITTLVRPGRVVYSATIEGNRAECLLGGSDALNVSTESCASASDTSTITQENTTSSRQVCGGHWRSDRRQNKGSVYELPCILIAPLNTFNLTRSNSAVNVSTKLIEPSLRWAFRMFSSFAFVVLPLRPVCDSSLIVQLNINYRTYWAFPCR
ncbi:MAG: hypothetical protein L6R42_007796 [Xanthoria sp. 1 TBL-2021]|nr:MAG: hypothetical protein L6R42_007796 [Xanthoria sp. 1 TBL-2021]